MEYECSHIPTARKKTQRNLEYSAIVCMQMKHLQLTLFLKQSHYTAHTRTFKETITRFNCLPKKERKEN